MSENITHLLTANNLQKTLGGNKVVQSIDISLQQGEVLGFLGPNGAGKTTSMRMLSGCLRTDNAQKGQITINQYDLLTQPLQAKASLGYMAEQVPMWQDMRVVEFLSFIGKAQGLEPKRLEARMQIVLNDLHLQDKQRELIETLSKGYKRRVGLAAALIHDPKVLILDEPTDGLDPNQKHELRGLVRNLAKEKAILISTHILEEVEALCTRIMIIHDGNIRFQGDKDAITKLDEAKTSATAFSQSLERVFRHYTADGAN